MPLRRYDFGHPLVTTAAAFAFSGALHYKTFSYLYTGNLVVGVLATTKFIFARFVATS